MRLNSPKQKKKTKVPLQGIIFLPESLRFVTSNKKYS